MLKPQKFLFDTPNNFSLAVLWLLSKVGTGSRGEMI
jgi:hypothetical protein